RGQLLRHDSEMRIPILRGGDPPYRPEIRTIRLLLAALHLVPSIVEAFMFPTIAALLVRLAALFLGQRFAKSMPSPCAASERAGAGHCLHGTIGLATTIPAS